MQMTKNAIFDLTVTNKKVMLIVVTASKNVFVLKKWILLDVK